MTDTKSHMLAKHAKTAGALYLAIAVCGAFSIGYVPSVTHTPGNEAATMQNLAAHTGLFRLGLIGDIAVLIFEVWITALLFTMFRPFGHTLAVIAALSRASMIVIMGGIIWLSAMALSFQASQPFATFAFLEAKAMGVFVWQLFFGIHLVALGLLALRSQIVPRALGWGLLIGSFGYTVQGVAKLTGVEPVLLGYGIIGLLVIVSLSEVLFGLWLLLRGQKAANPGV